MPMRWFYTSVAAVLMFLAAPAHAVTLDYTGEPLVEDAVVAVNGGDINAAGKRLRLASYNIEHFEDGLKDGKGRTRDVAVRHAEDAARIVEKLGADILVVQEVENAEALVLLNNALAKPYALGYVTNLGTGQRRREKLNLGVLSRVPMADVKEIDFGPLTGEGRPTRGLLRFSVDMGEGTKLLVYVLHLKSNFGSARRNIAQRTHALKLLRADAEHVTKSDASAQWEIVLAGDFNVDPDLPDFVNDTSLEPVSDWVDLWRGSPMDVRVTVPTRHGDPALEFPPASFDRFIVAPEMTQSPWKVERPVVLQVGTDTTNVHTRTGQGGHVSDHFPLYLDIVR
jgi:endonuclease/exonuclease/phosphatase family metal-dependent hydrolase